MKCKKCGYISFDYNELCPACNKELTSVKQDLGLYYSQPEVGTFDEFFTGASSSFRAKKSGPEPQEAELDLDNADDFEFTLDD